MLAPLPSGIICAAALGKLRKEQLNLNVEGESGDGNSAITTELSNRRLHCPLTKPGWALLASLLKRWSVSLDSGPGASPRGEDLAAPGDEPQADRRPPGVAVFGNVEEDASSRPEYASCAPPAQETPLLLLWKQYDHRCSPRL